MFKALPAKSGRQGLLILGGVEISTPNFIAPTIRGAIPHLTPDNYPQVPAAGIFAEDFLDLRGFTTTATENLPLNASYVIASVREPGALPLKKTNTDTDVGLSTFSGTRLMNIEKTAQFLNSTEADIVVVPYDAPKDQDTDTPVGKNRTRLMIKRSLEWLTKFDDSKAMVLATVPPQLLTREYLDEVKAKGLYLVGRDIPEIPSYPGIMVYGEKSGPHKILKLISKGIDLYYTDCEEYTDKGVALFYSFNDPHKHPFSLNLTNPEFERDMSELGTTNYAKAYIHHLLNAREMTAQVVLQQHNLSTVAQFFKDVRTAIRDDTFVSKSLEFKSVYCRSSY